MLHIERKEVSASYDPDLHAMLVQECAVEGMSSQSGEVRVWQKRKTNPRSQISTSRVRAMSSRASTSFGSRLKFSIEKAYTVT